MSSVNVVGAAPLVLVAGFVVLLFNSGTRFAMGLMLYPMTSDLGWSRSTLSLTVTAFMVVSACALPFAGRLVDLFGAWKVLGASVVVCAAGTTLMGLIETPGQALLMYGVVFALGSAGTSITPIGVLLVRWYPQRVGMANSVAISGMGVGQLLIISVLTSQLAVLGWRGSFFVLGGATLICVLPLVWVAGRGTPPESAGPPSAAPALDDGRRAGTLREALRSPRLRLLLVIYSLCGFQDFLIATHVVAFALDEGVGPRLAGNMLAFMGLAGIVGVLAAGALNDRFGPMHPSAACFLIRIGLFTLVLFSRDAASIVVVALLYGMTFWMTAPLAIVFTRQICALSLIGTVSGLITMVHHIAGGLGALAGAWVFDAFGSYDIAFVALLALSIATFGLTLVIERVDR